MAKRNTTKKVEEAKSSTPKKTTTAKSSPQAKKERTFTALQASKVLGAHRRYALHLNKRYGSDFKTISEWKALFIETGILIIE